jgi:hypothetical protein
MPEYWVEFLRAIAPILFSYRFNLARPLVKPKSRGYFHRNLGHGDPSNTLMLKGFGITRIRVGIHLP